MNIYEHLMKYSDIITGNASLIPESLRLEFRRLVNVEYDNVVNDILAYVIMRGQLHYTEFPEKHRIVSHQFIKRLNTWSRTT